VSNWEPMGRSGGALAPFGTSGDPPVALRLGLLLARGHVTDLANRTKHKNTIRNSGEQPGLLALHMCMMPGSRFS